MGTSMFTRTDFQHSTSVRFVTEILLTGAGIVQPSGETFGRTLYTSR